jgi:hypothetical protein
MPYIGKSPGQGVRNRFLYTATSGQTTFSGSDDDGRTLTYSDSKFTDVFLNGVLLDPNSDYNATTGTSIVLTSGATAGDIVEVISFDTFAVFNGNFTTENLNTESINGGQVGGRRNLIYNGAMQVAQRGTTITGVTTSTYQCDRWFYNSEAEETVTLEQSSDAPDGFGYSQKITVTTADADLTNDYVEIEQTFEGLDLQQLAWGTSSAKQLTVSLWVKSSQTGDCAIGLYMAGTATMIGSTFTINSANTWEYKTVTFAGNTTDAITNDNAQRLRLWIGLAAGSAYNGTDNTSWGAYTNAKRLYGQTLNLVGTTSATFQLTGVQMEVGSVATKFEHRSYGDELALCQRYCVVYTNDVDGAEHL